MVERVIIGTRGSDVGMWVSKPGRSVRSTNPADMLIDTTTVPLRPIIAGTITNPVLNADTNNFHAPTISSTTSIRAINDYIVNPVDNTHITVYGVGGTSYTSHTGAPNNDGLALYFKDYWFKRDRTALLSGGRIPLIHISIGDPNVGTNNATVGDNYPKIYVYDTKIRLAVYQNWDAVSSPSWYATTNDKKYWPTYENRGGNLWWTYVYPTFGVSGEAGSAGVQRAYYGPSPTSTLQTNCIIHYAVYNKPMSLP